MAGLIILLVSIAFSINSLYPRTKIPVLDLKEFFEDWKNNKIEDNSALMETIIDNVEELETYNNTKAENIKISYVLTLTGLAITFSGIAMSFIL